MGCRVGGGGEAWLSHSSGQGGQHLPWAPASPPASPPTHSDSLAEQTLGLTMEVSGRQAGAGGGRPGPRVPLAPALPPCRQRREEGCGSCYPGGPAGLSEACPHPEKGQCTGNRLWEKRLETAGGCGNKGWRWAEVRGAGLLRSISGGGCPNTEQGPGGQPRAGGP